MTGEPVVLVDPLCLCGRPHPCELHGPMIDKDHEAGQVRLDGRLLLWLMDDDYRATRGRQWGQETPA